MKMLRNKSNNLIEDARSEATRQ